MVRVSVVIPTCNRRDTLAAVLAALDAQVGAPDFEVVVVDDGSTDGTAGWLRGRRGARPLEVLTQENRGPAAARNAGVRAALGRWVAFLGDDTVPAPDWLATLVAAAEDAQGRARFVAILGRTRWHRRLRLTRFLRYAEEGGLQFGYGLIQDPEDVPFQFFYTSNILVERQALLDEPFCEAFPYAAWEDTEVSLRLCKAGMRILYRPAAVTEHDHPSSLGSFLERQERAGYAAVVFHALHPEVGDLVCLGPEGPPPPLPPLARLRHHLRELVARLLEPFPVEMPETWNRVLRVHYFRGMRRAWRDRGSAA